jgi:hypothetical protein
MFIKQLIIVFIDEVTRGVIELSIRLEWFPCKPSFGKRRMGVCGYELF